MDQGHQELSNPGVAGGREPRSSSRPRVATPRAPSAASWHDEAPPPRPRTIVVPPIGARPAAPVFRAVPYHRLWTTDWHIVRSFVAAYAVCAISFTGLYVAIEAFSKIQRFIPSGKTSFVAGLTQFVVNLSEYHLAMVPTIYVNYMGPILTLSAAMFSVVHLNRGNEFVPLAAAGVSIYRALVPIFFLAVLLTGWTVFLQEWVVPGLREPIRRALAISRSGMLRPRPFYDPVYDLDIQVKRYAPDQKVAEGVTITRWSFGGEGKGEPENRITDAERMVWVPDPDSNSRAERGHWLLRTGATQSWQARWRGEPVARADERNVPQLRQTFDEMPLESSLVPIDLETSDQDISYLSWGELKAQSRRQPYHRHLVTRLHYHFAFPLSHVILLLLGLPFALGSATRSYFLSVVVAFFLCAAYFLVSSMSLSLASQASEHSSLPVLASWLPNILFGSLGLTIFTHMRT